MTPPRSGVIRLAVAIAAVAGIGGFVFAAATQTNHLPDATPIGLPRARTGVAPALTSRFAVFQKKRDKAATLAAADSTLRSLLAKTVQHDPQFGLDLARAITVAVTPAMSITVIPGSAGACLIAPIPSSAEAVPDSGAGFAGSCGPTAIVEKAGFGSTIGRHFAWGLVPNGTTVSIKAANGESKAVPVVDNTYYIHSTKNFTVKKNPGNETLNSRPRAMSRLIRP